MILWGPDHQAKAEALAGVLHEHSASIAGINPPVCTDPTLTIWGHGDAQYFAELEDVKLGLLIKAWKTRNKELKTVELVTCNAQHNVYPLASYAQRIVKFLAQYFKDITVKAMPLGRHKDDQSILYANADTETICYITAPTVESFNLVNQRFKTLYEDTSRYHHNCNEIAQQLAKEAPQKDPYSVIGGNFTDLRKLLAIVKAIETVTTAG